MKFLKNTILVASYGTTSTSSAKLFGKFKKVIDGKLFWFAVTRLGLHDPVVTHIESGRCVCAISSLQISARCGDALAAGKAALDAFVASHGDEALFAKRLEAAPPLNPKA